MSVQLVGGAGMEGVCGSAVEKLESLLFARHAPKGAPISLTFFD
ncbi:MAG TPA: hypothetical protein VEK78_09935 [Gemmatimonadales bacterium]|nr:hypothetical protein [Gemmatimonadales bacterium]